MRGQDVAAVPCEAGHVTGQVEMLRGQRKGLRIHEKRYRFGSGIDMFGERHHAVDHELCIER